MTRAISYFPGRFGRTYHYHNDQDKAVETRNVSGQTLKQQVRGVRYVDELVQIALNDTPSTSNYVTRVPQVGCTHQTCASPITMTQVSDYPDPAPRPLPVPANDQNRSTGYPARGLRVIQPTNAE